MADLRKSLIIIAATPLVVAWSGYCYAIVWGWYAAPIFGLPTLAWWQATGLLLLLHSAFPRKPEDADLLVALMRTLIQPLVLLVLGWLCLRMGG